jgi:predicted Zn-dependent protease with MMP-like domain
MAVGRKKPGAVRRDGASPGRNGRGGAGPGGGGEVVPPEPDQGDLDDSDDADEDDHGGAHDHGGVCCACGHDHGDDDASGRDPDDPVEQAWAAYDDDRFEDAIELAEKQLDAGAEGDDAAELLHVIGVALLDLGDPDGAFDALTDALARAPDDPALLSALGEAELERWKFEDALKTLRRAVGIAHDEPFPHRLLAETLDRMGRSKEADKHFARAQALDPELFPRPFRLNRRSFDQVVESAIAGLPAPIKDRLGDLRFEVHDYPEPIHVELDDGPGSPRTLGFFHATPFPEQRSDAGLSYNPQHILLFQRNLEHVVSDRKELEEEIRTTVIHEVGHYLGLDEEELEEMGLS